MNKPRSILLQLAPNASLALPLYIASTNRQYPNRFRIPISSPRNLPSPSPSSSSNHILPI